MNEFMKYITILKTILDMDYEKERVFYSDGDWYDRQRCRNITIEELERDVLSIIENSIRSIDERDFYVEKLEEKITGLMGKEAAETFLDACWEESGGSEDEN